ncbi:hypothetical protein COV20_03030 [Candidatus Woesearchaeota archaeon CG10_big_fil_rev_8_21_14_0_10_45_16]|nr:MAG: hypothetical protein COV20_03030 [Candidatus Woesearchaeota archaeon CG10_big_fil_rev_8_21_14_0_10_45_16]
METYSIGSGALPDEDFVRGLLNRQKQECLYTVPVRDLSSSYLLDRQRGNLSGPPSLQYSRLENLAVNSSDLYRPLDKISGLKPYDLQPISSYKGN